jgi:hypothetical protein
VAEDNNKVIISRIQNRRGLKQDLPQPLRPGELGFAYDTRQVFIGADPSDAISGGYNTQSIFETTVGAKDFTSSIANNNIVAFTVPFKKYGKGFFDGITKTVSYLPSSNTTSSSSLKVFPSNTLVSTTAVPSANITSNVITLSASPNVFITVGDIVTGSAVNTFIIVEEISGNTITLSNNVSVTTADTLTFVPNNLLNAETNLPFKAADLLVNKNGVRIAGDSSNTTPAAAYEYSFAANTSAANTHIVTFRTAPLASEEVTICYYSNTAIIQAIEGITVQSNTALNGNISLYNVGENAFPSFYTAYSIPSYRQIPRELITVSSTTGTGFIGLQNKHIAVNADSGEIDSPTSLSLGNLLLSRSDWGASSNVTPNTANIVFTVGTVPTYNVGGPYNYIYVDNTVGYLNGKVFQISQFSNVTPSVTVVMPSNAFTVARSVTANAAGTGANVTVTLTGNVDGVSQGANILIVDGSNTSGLAGEIVEVENNPATGVIVFNTGSASFLSNASVQFINYGDDITGNSKVQIFSTLHGYSNVDQVNVTSSNTSAIANTTFSVLNDIVTQNTFFIAPTAPVVGQISGLLSPDLNPSTVDVTPVRSIDLSSNTTLAEISSTVNDIDDWPFLGIIPDSENKIYITHKPEYTSVGLNFRLHEDYDTTTKTALTLGPLSLTESEYTRDDTVKAKLEKWVNSCLESDLVDLFSTAGVGVKYTTNSALTRTVGQYQVAINNTYDEIDFSSREEARDFNKLVNTIFFERPDPDNENIKGLVNLKTNIELQTRSSVALGDRTVSYAELNSASIPSGGGNISSLTQSVDVYDTYQIDYSITEASSVIVTGENYQRIGTIFVSGRTEFNGGSGAVLFQDVASEMIDTGLSGNVTFNASLVGTNIVFNVTNTVGRELAMKYLVKRWSSL